MPQPRDMMDTYLSILLSIDAINPEETYKQSTICSLVSTNETYVNNTLNNPSALQSVLSQYLEEAQIMVIIDRQQDCG